MPRIVPQAPAEGTRRAIFRHVVLELGVSFVIVTTIVCLLVALEGPIVIGVAADAAKDNSDIGMFSRACMKQAA